MLGGLVWWLRKQNWAEELRPYFFPALLLKLLCGVLLGLLYFKYYGGGDTIAYFKGALKLSAYAKQNFAGYTRLLFLNEFESDTFKATIPFSTYPSFSNSFFTIKIISVLNLITGSSYYLNGLYLSLFSFWGAAKLAATLIKLFPKYKVAAIAAFLFFPSVIFWTSGLSKDSLMFGSMCWVVAFALTVPQRVNWTASSLALLMLWIFYKIKFFFAFIVLPLLVLYVLVKVLARSIPLFQQRRVQLLALTVALIVAGIAAIPVFQIYRDGFLYENIVQNYNDILALSEGKPTINLQIEPTPQSIIRNAPEALLSAIYRPFIWEVDNMLYWAVAAENVLLAILSVMGVIGVVRGKFKVEVEHVTLLALVLVVGAICGLTTPNFGSLSRYRVAFLPFLVYLLLQGHYSNLLLTKLKMLGSRRSF
ncbi:hypothetical protein [Pontibacter harenae]|uniref:hypothetical protein n=1 Tax=Pontibacter harenae TaxID=2894083 RepID=UPI001E6401D7|nr:hypothetical protein [Pontibacter harenae]MCC9167173.1 hypothetical protein [Pontibacter harenae]